MAKVKKNKGFIIMLILIIVIAVIGVVALILNNIFSNKSLEEPGKELGFDIFVGDENMAVTTSADEGRDLVEELKGAN